MAKGTGYFQWLAIRNALGTSPKPLSWSWILPRGKSPRRSRHIGEMRDSGTKVTFDPQPLRAGPGEWHIVATYHPSGQQEHISGFRDEADAKEWLTGKGCQAWLKARGYAE